MSFDEVARWCFEQGVQVGTNVTWQNDRGSGTGRVVALPIGSRLTLVVVYTTDTGCGVQGVSHQDITAVEGQPIERELNK